MNGFKAVYNFSTHSMNMDEVRVGITEVLLFRGRMQGPYFQAKNVTVLDSSREECFRWLFGALAESNRWMTVKSIRGITEGRNVTLLLRFFS